jgi:hypothetical protein
MERPSWAPEGIDVELPSAARMYDYYLGGSHNFSADREVARKALSVLPQGPILAQSNRSFLRRAVQWCAAQGITQFLDIGSGIPTLGNVHEVAQAAVPEARVAYIDIDPVAIAHSLAILANNDRATASQGDLRDPRGILDNPEVTKLIDFSQPVAVLMVAVLHFVPRDEDIIDIVTTFSNETVPGSYIVISHATDEGWPEESRRIVDLYRNTANPLTLRNKERIGRFFNGYRIVDPGVVLTSEWHPESSGTSEPQSTRAGVYAGVGRKE